MSTVDALDQRAADADAKNWLSLPQAVRRLSADVSEAMLRRAVGNGALKSTLFFKRRLVHDRDLREWAGSRYIGA